VVPAPYNAPGTPALVVRMPRGGAIQAIDFRGLRKWGLDNDCLVVLKHPVGDFVPAGAGLIEVYGEANGGDAEGRLLSIVAFGVERTAFRGADEGTRTLDLLHGNPPRHAQVGSAAA